LETEVQRENAENLKHMLGPCVETRDLLDLVSAYKTEVASVEEKVKIEFHQKEEEEERVKTVMSSYWRNCC
jgi:hypothetical protein